MKIVAVEDARELRLADLLEMLEGDEAIVLTQANEERYVLGALDDLDAEALSLSRNEELMALLDACRARGAREGGTALEEARRELLAEG